VRADPVSPAPVPHVLAVLSTGRLHRGDACADDHAIAWRHAGVWSGRASGRPFVCELAAIKGFAMSSHGQRGVARSLAAAWRTLYAHALPTLPPAASAEAAAKMANVAMEVAALLKRFQGVVRFAETDVGGGPMLDLAAATEEAPAGS